MTAITRSRPASAPPSPVGNPTATGKLGKNR